MSRGAGRAEAVGTRGRTFVRTFSDGIDGGRRGALVAGAVTALAALFGCDGGAAQRPDATGGEDLARISARLESVQSENRKLGEKLDRLEKRLEPPAAANPAAAVAKPAALPGSDAATAARPRTLKPAVVADEFTLKVQRALKAADYDPGPPDGKKGRRTTTALKKFQRDKNLPETGMADEATWVLLKRHLD